MPTTPERAIYERLHSAPAFHPANANIFADDWALEPGDIVTVKSGEETYSVPVYSMDLRWNGAIETEIASTGNQKREPLPALKRREYASNARGYGLQRELDEEVQRFTTKFEQTDHDIRLIATETDLETLETLGQSMYQITSNDITSITQKTGIDSLDQQETLYSKITQNAEGITSIVSQSGTVTAVFSESAHYNVGDRVLVKVNDVLVAYKFTEEHNPGPWTGQDATAISDLQSQITQNATGVESLVSKTGVDRLGQSETLYSKIIQNAGSISSIVSQSGTVTEEFSDSKSYQKNALVVHEGKLYRFKVAHSGPWAWGDVEAVDDLQSRVTTAESNITQEADRIGLVVTGYGNNKTVNTAKIILAINGGGKHSEAEIEADKITIGKNDSSVIKLSDKITVLNGEVFIYANTVDASNMTATEFDVTAEDSIVTFSNGDFYCSSTAEFANLSRPVEFYGGIRFGDSDAPTILPSEAGGIIKSVSVANNTLTLTKLDGNTVNFSKATAMGGAWSGSTYTVTASQTNYNTTTEEYETTPVGTASVAIADWTWTHATSYRRVVTGTDDDGSTTYNVTLPTLTVVGRTPNSPAAVAVVDVYGPEINGESYTIAMGTIWLKQTQDHVYIVNTNSTPDETSAAKNVMAKQALPTVSAVAMSGPVTQSGTSWVQDATVTMSNSKTATIENVDVSAAYNAVTLTSNWMNSYPYWDSHQNKFIVTASNNTENPKYAWVSLCKAAWNNANDTCWVYALNADVGSDVTYNTNTHRQYRISRINIEGSSRVYKGSNAVTLASPTWSEYQGSGLPTARTVSVYTSGRVNTSGASAELHQDISLSLTVASSWSGGYKTVQLTSGGTAYAQASVAAPTVNSVTMAGNVTRDGSVWNDTATVALSSGTSSTKTVDVTGAYTTGFNAVTLTPNWTKTASPNPDPNNTYTVAADNGQGASTYLRLYCNGQFNSSHKTYVYLMNHGTFTADSYKKATLEVNATSVYTEGCDSVNPVSATISQSTQSGGGNS